MDEPVRDRYNRLLAKLAARTKPDGTPKRNFAQNVAAIKAELEILEEKLRGSTEEE